MPPRSLGAVRRTFAPWTDAAAEPFVRFEAVTKRFGEVTAVDDISLDVYQREFFSLLGPSGCGKTTLMRMLAGFEEPNGGRILLDGQDLQGIPPYRRPVNMMFQSYALFPHMSVEENIAFGLRQDRLPRQEIRTRVEQMLSLVKLDEMAKRRPHQLSGGQRQRVALARSLVKRPKVLLLDEPLGALDKKLRQEMQFELMDIQANLGMTFLVVTHDQEEAMVLSDRIAVMEHGRIVQVATPSEIYEYPNSRYVADFIGDINLIEAQVAARTPEESVLESREAGARFVVSADQPLTVGQTVWLAVRPEKMRVTLDPTSFRCDNTLTGEVWDIAYFGDWTSYLVKLASGKAIRVAQANEARFVERPIGWEDKVLVGFDRDAGVVLTR